MSTSATRLPFDEQLAFAFEVPSLDEIELDDSFAPRQRRIHLPVDAVEVVCSRSGFCHPSRTTCNRPVNPPHATMTPSSLPV